MISGSDDGSRGIALIALAMFMVSAVGMTADAKVLEAEARPVSDMVASHGMYSYQIEDHAMLATLADAIVTWAPAGDMHGAGGRVCPTQPAKTVESEHFRPVSHEPDAA